MKTVELIFAKASRDYHKISKNLMENLTTFSVTTSTSQQIIQEMYQAFYISYWKNIDIGLRLFSDASVILAKLITDCERKTSSEEYNKLVSYFFDIDELVKTVSIQKASINLNHLH